MSHPRTTFLGHAGAAATLGLTLLCSGCGSKPSRVHTHGAVPAALAWNASAQVREGPITQDASAPAFDDAQFVQDAAVAGDFEVQSSQHVLGQNIGGGVAGFAQRMVLDHERAHHELKAAAAEVGLTLPDKLDAKHQKMVDKLQRTKDGLAALYVQQQLEAHRQAVALFERAERELPTGPVQEFAQRSLPTLREHQKAIQALAQDVDSQPKR